MNLKGLNNTPPWDWPEGTATMLLDVLQDGTVPEPDLLFAIEAAGNMVVVNDQLVGALLTILRDGGKSEQVRAGAAIALGPVLEQVDMDGFDDPDDSPIAQRTFATIQASLRTLYAEATVPQEVRRRILEGSVRAAQEWHHGAIAAAWASRDEAWRLTAAFCMRFVRGFDAQIREALGSPNQDVRYQAIVAAGNWEMTEAWPHVAALLTSPAADKDLLLAAIEASATIRPDEALPLLYDLAGSNDEDVADAVREALAMAKGLSDDDEAFGDDDDDDEAFGDDDEEEVR
jgi:HEAT repeat protein